MHGGATFQLKTDLQRLCADIARAAEVAEAPFDADATWSFINPFKEFFAGCAISFRTSTKPKEKRALNVRYMEHGVLHDPFKIASEAGLFEKLGHPSEALVPELQARFPLDGYGGYGVDCGAAYGFEKIWLFFNGAQPIAEFYKVPSMPAAFSAHADYFARYGLSGLRVWGVDFRDRTTNAYFFATDLPAFNVDIATGMIQDLGFPLPPREWLEHCAISVPIYFTFKWDSPRIERLCFCSHAEASQVPVHLDPLVERFVAEAPILTPHRMFIYNITLAQDGHFVKIENDYTGTVCMQMRNAVAA